MLNIYREAKAKYRQRQDDNMYINYITDVVSQMFKWDSKIWRPILFDRMIRDAGMAALVKTDTSDYTPVWFNPIDSGSGRYADGWFKDCVCFDFRGKEYRYKDWDSNPDILVFFNNGMRYPDCFVDKYATVLSDVDTSLANNVFYSRMHPFPVARDRKTKNRIDQVIKDVSTGSNSTVLMEGSLSDILDGDDIKVINLTDVTKQEYLQHLSHLHDNLIARLFFMLGLGTTDNGKQAQITKDELNKNDDASITQALAWYNARKEGIEKAREKGHELEFDFSDIWKARVESILNANQPEEGVEEDDNRTDNEPDISGNDGEPSE